MIMKDSDALIPLSEPFFSERELQHVQECILSGWVSSAGPKTEALEDAVKAYTGSGDVVAVNSGTSALHLALLGAGVSTSDLVLVSGMSFIASANVVRYCNAEPVFVDIDPFTWQTDPNVTLKWLDDQCVFRGGLTYHISSGKCIRAMILVHAFGFPAPAVAFQSALQARGIELVEDAAGAMGTRMGGIHVGTLGRFGCISLNGNKIITAGSGGLILCRDAQDGARLRHLSRQAKQPGTAYTHDALGYNYRMPDICAALALAQLEQLETFLIQKRKIMQTYRSALPELQWQEFDQGCSPNAWLNVCMVPDRDAWIHTLRNENISASEVWMPLDIQPIYNDSLSIHECKNALDVYRNAISIPGSVSLSLIQQDKIIKILKELLSASAM
jgi:perosamine synthetase